MKTHKRSVSLDLGFLEQTLRGQPGISTDRDVWVRCTTSQPKRFHSHQMILRGVHPESVCLDDVGIESSPPSILAVVAHPDRRPR